MTPQKNEKEIYAQAGYLFQFIYSLALFVSTFLHYSKLILLSSKHLFYSTFFAFVKQNSCRM